MAITINYYGTEMTQVRAQGNAPLKPNELNGRVRIARFNFTVPSGDAADGSNVAVIVLPKGARIMGGVVKGEALGNSSVMDVGLRGNDGSGFINTDNDVADDDDFFLAAGATNGAFNLTFADTTARNYGYELQKECQLVLTADTGAWDPGQDIVGHVEFVVD